MVGLNGLILFLKDFNIILMNAKISLLLLVFVAKLNAQFMEISVVLKDSCYIESQTNALEITVYNNSATDYWVDLHAIKFTLMREDRVIDPGDETTIGFFIPVNVSRNGFIFIQKSSKRTITNLTSIFNNYSFEKGVDYRLKWEYGNPRKRLLKKIFNQDMNTDYITFSRCD